MGLSMRRRVFIWLLLVCLLAPSAAMAGISEGVNSASTQTADTVPAADPDHLMATMQGTNAYVTADNSRSKGAALGSVEYDLAEWPRVTATIHNTHAYWMKVSRFDQSPTVHIVERNVWAEFGYMPGNTVGGLNPQFRGAAVYTIEFDEFRSSSIQFYLTTGSTQDASPPAGLLTLVQIAAQMSTGEDMTASLGLLSPAEWDRILTIVSSIDACVEAVTATNSAFLTVNLLQCLGDERNLDVLEPAIRMIASKQGINVDLALLKNAFTVKTILDLGVILWDQALSLASEYLPFMSGYYGSFSGSVRFSAYVNQPHTPSPPAPTPPPAPAPTPTPGTAIDPALANPTNTSLVRIQNMACPSTDAVSFDIWPLPFAINPGPDCTAPTTSVTVTDSAGNATQHDVPGFLSLDLPAGRYTITDDGSGASASLDLPREDTRSRRPPECNGRASCVSIVVNMPPPSTGTSPVASGSLTLALYACPAGMRPDMLDPSACSPTPNLVDFSLGSPALDGRVLMLADASLDANRATWSDLPFGTYLLQPERFAPGYSRILIPDPAAEIFGAAPADGVSLAAGSGYRVPLTTDQPDLVLDVYVFSSAPADNTAPEPDDPANTSHVQLQAMACPDTQEPEIAVYDRETTADWSLPCYAATANISITDADGRVSTYSIPYAEHVELTLPQGSYTATDLDSGASTTFDLPFPSTNFSFSGVCGEYASCAAVVISKPLSPATEGWQQVTWEGVTLTYPPDYVFEPHDDRLSPFGDGNAPTARAGAWLYPAGCRQYPDCQPVSFYLFPGEWVAPGYWVARNISAVSDARNMHSTTVAGQPAEAWESGDPSQYPGVLYSYVLSAGSEILLVRIPGTHYSAEDFVVSVPAAASPVSTDQMDTSVTSSGPEPDSVASGTLPATYLGTWEGIGFETNPPVDWPITVTVAGGEPGAIVGATDYPDNGCGGDLILEEVTADSIVLIEDLTYGEAVCADGGTITLELLPDGSISFEWKGIGATGPSTATGTLYRIGGDTDSDGGMTIEPTGDAVPATEEPSMDTDAPGGVSAPVDAAPGDAQPVPIEPEG